MPGGGLLDALAAPVESVAGEPDDVEGVHDGDRVGELLGGCGFEAGEPIHGDDLDAVPPGLWPVGQPLFEHGFRTAFDHVQ